MSYAHKIRVGVLRGGNSPEYKVSLETGKNILKNLPEEYYAPVDIFITRDGAWHDGGMQRAPERILKRTDVVWNALHGGIGEDGTVQKILRRSGIPFTGSNPLASAMGMNKVAAKKVYKDNGIKTPFATVLSFPSLTRELIRKVYEEVPMPFVVKPSSTGSSVGVRIVDSLPELEEAVVAAFEYSPQVLVEEFINGEEVFCGVIDNFRDADLYPMIPFSEKPVSRESLDLIKEASLKAHKALGLRHYSSSDFIVHPKRGVFILETDVLPEIREESKIKKSLESIGSNVSEFVHHVLGMAMKGK